MEPCISDFLDNCDENSDHSVTLMEWGQCLKESKGRLLSSVSRKLTRSKSPLVNALTRSWSGFLFSLYLLLLLDALEDKCAEFKKLATEGTAAQV